MRLKRRAAGGIHPLAQALKDLNFLPIYKNLPGPFP